MAIRGPSGETGKIIVQPTDRRTGQASDALLVFQPIAEEGVRDAARELGVNLDDFDVVVSEFAYHPVDTPPSIYYGAARSAFRSAWEAWERYYAFANKGHG